MTQIDLGAAFRGRVITQEDPAFDEARRVVNLAIDRRPELMLQAADQADVIAAVRLARERGLELAVRGGGHNAAGFGTTDGGIVLHTSGLRQLDIDPATRTAWAGAGLTAGEYTAAAAEHGLATGFGDTGSVGIAGLTLGGGIGYLVRKHGLTVDDLLGAELVTADGELLQVNTEQHPDLFWALRGGGGNFGVVTRLRYRLHEVATVLGGMLVLPASGKAFSEFVAFADAAPEELSMIAAMGAAPPLPMLPAEYHGTPVMMVMLVYAGDPAAGEVALEPLRALGTPLFDGVAALPYRQMYEGPEPPSVRMAVRSTYADELDVATAEALLDHGRSATAPVAMVQVRVLGGAIARVPADATAFPHRRRRMVAIAGAGYMDPAQDAEQQQWAEAALELLGPTAGGAFTNFMAAEGEDRVRAAYGDNYDRLRQVKSRYDPDNVFRLNQNLPPAG